MLQKRNLIVHGNLKTKNYEEIFIATNAYYTLLSRIILKLLGYVGYYYDYSNPHHPILRDIDESIEGKE